MYYFKLLLLNITLVVLMLLVYVLALSYREPQKFCSLAMPICASDEIFLEFHRDFPPLPCGGCVPRANASRLMEENAEFCQEAAVEAELEANLVLRGLVLAIVISCALTTLVVLRGDGKLRRFTKKG